MKLSSWIVAGTSILFSLMMVPSFAKDLPAPPPIDNDSASQDLPTETPTQTSNPLPVSQSNIGAINEGGGSSNTNGMNNGLMPNSSGSGTNAALATDYSGIPFGGTGKPTSGEVQPEK
jgi:hypothetical protein